jgi:RNA polymerase sigma-70 factor, ECF subfamily
MEQGLLMKEEELIVAARAGDEAAFQELRRLHFTCVRTACWAILHTDDLDEVVQETFIDAWKGLKTFRGESTFKTWIMSIARRRAFKVLNQRKRSGAFLAELPDEDHSLLIEERSAAILESSFDLARLMSGLPTRSRQLLEMNLEGLSDREIAEARALSLRTVRGCLQRGKDAMRRIVGTSPEQTTARGSLMGEANSGDEKKMTARPSERRKRGAGQKRRSDVDSPLSGRDDAALNSVGPVLPASSQDSAPFSFEDLVAEVAQLEYLSAIEARSKFEAEIVREGGNLVRRAIRNLPAAAALEEEAVFAHLVRAMAGNAIVREDLARLQRLPMGVHSREIRLWYVEAIAQHLLPDVVSEALRVEAAPASEGTA